MLLYEPNSVLGIRSPSHFFYQCRQSIQDDWGGCPILNEWVAEVAISDPHGFTMEAAGLEFYG